MPKAIGIDLGTTNSAMAVMEGGEPSLPPALGRPLVTGARGRPFTRTHPAVQGTFRSARRG